MQQIAAGGEPGMQYHRQALGRQPAKNALQVIPAGIPGHLRIVPAGAEQAAAEKRIVNIDGEYRQRVVQLFQFAADILAQQIVQFTNGNHYSGVTQRRAARREFANIEMAGLLGAEPQRRAIQTVGLRRVEPGVQPID
ncbi:Uncharacterised protein [Klebsiella michiganensis]|nr:Uncharacterised protein [Klebsiella michiganensis]